MKQHFLYTEGGGFKPTVVANPDEIEFIIIDLFCGAGGTTTGFDMAQIEGKKIALIAACVNHDWKALKSHWQNHPEVVHFEEDIRTLELSPLVDLINKYRLLYPNAKVILWGSLECTNFSKAKGGLSRDPDSRTLAVHLPRYIEALNPDYIQIENVVEFMSWGPLRIKAKKHHKANKELGTYAYTELKMGVDKKTGEECYWWTPISKLNGRDWRRWRESICDMGYVDEWKQMNAADYGAYTSRNRLFGCFAKPGLPIVWPDTTHAKKATKEQSLSLFTDGPAPKQKWKAVKDVLDFDDEGESLFNRIRPIKHVKHAKQLLSNDKKVKQVFVLPAIRTEFVEPLIGTKDNLHEFDRLVEAYHAKHGRVDLYYYDELADKSLERTYEGLIKFVANTTKKAFLMNYNSTAKNGSQKQAVRSMDEPCPAVPTQNRLYACFIQKTFSGRPAGKVNSVFEPSGAVTCGFTPNLVQPEFIQQRNSGNPEGRVVSVDGPARSLTSTAGNQDLTQIKFLTNYQGSSNALSVNTTAPALLTRDKLALHHVKVDQIKGFLAKYYGTGGQLNSIEEAGPTVTARENLSKMQLVWLERPFSGGGQHSSVDEPAGAIMAQRAKLNLMTAQPYIMNTNYNNVGSSIEAPLPPLMAGRRHYYLVNPSYFGHAHPVNEPCPVIIARQDKSPLYLIQIEYADVFIPIYDDDSEVMQDIKVFMALYGISDIKMRMLKVSELLPIQGFPTDYYLFGNQSDQKKFIGNSVHPLVPKFWAEAMGSKNREIRRMAA